MPDITRDDFILNSKSESRKLGKKIALGQFDLFCQKTHNKNGDDLTFEKCKQAKETQSQVELLKLLNKFNQWLQVDHPEIILTSGKNGSNKRQMKARLPATVRAYVNIIRNYFEYIGDLEISDRKYETYVKLPEIEIEEDPEPFTHDQIKQFLDAASPQKRLLYMVLKDSGMRIGEAVSLRKRDIDLEKDPVEIHIPAKFTKTKKARTSFVTKETASLLKHKLLRMNESDLILTKIQDRRNAVENETQVFNYYRKKLGFTAKYEHNGRHKKTVHSFRSFTCTQAEVVHGESFAHALIGHKRYLSQYVRNQDKLPIRYKKLEPKLLIYEKIEVVEHDEEIAKLTAEVGELKKTKQEMSSLNGKLQHTKLQLAELIDNAIEDPVEFKEMIRRLRKEKHRQHEQIWNDA